MMATVTICGLGPGGRHQITQETIAAIEGHDPESSFVRTKRHPTADVMGDARSFDDLYDSAETLDEVYNAIADVVAETALTNGSSLYAVPGSPLILERAVRHLVARTDIDVSLIPAVSFLDATWAALAIDPVEEAVRLIDGHTFSRDAAGESGPLLVAHTHARWVLSDIKLAMDIGPEQKAIFLQGLGTPNERITEVPWPELDRSVEPNHLTSLYLPDVVEPVAGEVLRSTKLMHRLRQECPWDQEQTHASLGRYLIEEAYEVIEAIEEVEAGANHGYEHLEEELGDLWFQLLFHCEMAAEAGEFTLADVARTAHDKLVDRHPHVFGEVEAADAAAVAANWEAIKKVEKGRQSVMDGIPSALPALIYSEKVLKKGLRVDFPQNAELVSSHLKSGLAQSPTPDEVGDFLLAAVARSLEAGVDPELSLRAATQRAVARFNTLDAGDRSGRWVLG